jgi:hypothetical protein
MAEKGTGFAYVPQEGVNCGGPGKTIEEVGKPDRGYATQIVVSLQVRPDVWIIVSNPADPFVAYTFAEICICDGDEPFDVFARREFCDIVAVGEERGFVYTVCYKGVRPAVHTS